MENQIMEQMTIRQIIQAVNGTFFGPEDMLEQSITGVEKDNRKIQPGYLFIPFQGAKVDGHDFIPAAVEAGAIVVLSEKDLSDRIKEWGMDDSFAYILVDSCPQALKDLAAYYRQTLSATIVGVVGSVGKTSTKEMIASVLQQKFQVQKTEGNYNNEIGLPLTILTIRKEHQVAVVEMGISEFGEMTRLAQIARPDVVVMTNIGYCHLEQLKDRDGILKAKSEVIDYIKESGTLVLNGDDDKLSTIQEREGLTLKFYGMEDKEKASGESTFAPDKEVYANQMHAVGTSAQAAHVVMKSGEFDVVIPIAGEHNVYNGLAAACIGETLGLSAEEIQRGMEQVQTISGRNRHFDSDGVTIIDDCYNANPVSMKASLDVLNNAQGRKIAALGDMGELGSEEKQLHYGVGEHMGELSIDLLCTVGALAKEIEAGAKASKAKTQMHHFETKEEMAEFLLKEKKPGDTILIKASHFMAFDQVVRALENKDETM